MNAQRDQPYEAPSTSKLGYYLTAELCNLGFQGRKLLVIADIMNLDAIGKQVGLSRTTRLQAWRVCAARLEK